MVQKTFIVLGAGLAGLSLAHELIRLGGRVVILEREAEVGGLARTVKQQGFRSDLGGHRFYSDCPDVINWLQELLGRPDLLNVQRRSHIFIRNNLIDYPLRLPNALKAFSPSMTASVLGSYLLAKLKRNGGQQIVSFQDWITEHFGKTLYQVYFQPYTEKVLGIPCHAISAEWAKQRVGSLNLGQTILRTIHRGKQSPKTTVTNFLYPRLGIGMITDRLAFEIERSVSGQIISQAEVEKVWARDGIYHICYRQGEERRELCGQHVISTIPITTLLQCLDGATGGSLLTGNGSLAYRALICVFLKSAKPQVSHDTWTYLPESKFSSGRVHEPKNWSQEMAPKNQSSVCLEFYCDAGDRVWQSSDKTLVEKALGDLRMLGWVGQGEVLHAAVERVQYAYPVLRKGYEKELQKIESYLQRWPNLHLVGRTGSFRYSSMDEVVQQAIALARRLYERG